LLTPEDALRQFEARIVRLEADLARTEAVLTGFGRTLPRIVLIEEEYRQATLRAELEWVSAIVADLRSGRFTRSDESLRALVSSPAMGDARGPEEGAT